MAWFQHVHAVIGLKHAAARCKTLYAHAPWVEARCRTLHAVARCTVCVHAPGKAWRIVQPEPVVESSQHRGGCLMLCSDCAVLSLCCPCAGPVPAGTPCCLVHAVPPLSLCRAGSVLSLCRLHPVLSLCVPQAAGCDLPAHPDAVLGLQIRRRAPRRHAGKPPPYLATTLHLATRRLSHNLRHAACKRAHTGAHRPTLQRVRAHPTVRSVLEVRTRSLAAPDQAWLAAAIMRAHRDHERLPWSRDRVCRCTRTRPPSTSTSGSHQHPHIRRRMGRKGSTG